MARDPMQDVIDWFLVFVIGAAVVCAALIAWAGWELWRLVSYMVGG